MFAGKVVNTAVYNVFVSFFKNLIVEIFVFVNGFVSMRLPA